MNKLNGQTVHEPTTQFQVASHQLEIAALDDRLK